MLTGQDNGCSPKDRIIAQKTGRSVMKSVQERASQQQRSEGGW